MQKKLIQSGAKLCNLLSIHSYRIAKVCRLLILLIRRDAIIPSRVFFLPLFELHLTEHWLLGVDLDMTDRLMKPKDTSIGVFALK